MEKVRISYSSSKEVKKYLDEMAERYNMTVSGVLTMIVMQHKFQNETMSKFDMIQDLVKSIELIDQDQIANLLPKQPTN